MTAGSIIMMIIGLGITWGSGLWCLLRALKCQKNK